MSAATAPEPYRSASWVAAWLGVEQETIRTWARTGVIRGYQPGGRHWLFKASEVDADIEKSRPRTPDQAAEQTPLARRPQRVGTERVTSLRELVREGRL